MVACTAMPVVFSIVGKHTCSLRCAADCTIIVSCSNGRGGARTQRSRRGSATPTCLCLSPSEVRWLLVQQPAVVAIHLALAEELLVVVDERCGDRLQMLGSQGRCRR